MSEVFSVIVTFCGHREIVNRDELRDKLNAAIIGLISEGADTFYLGGYGAFDSLANEVLHELKDQYHIHTSLVLPYLDRDYLTDIYDDTIYPPLESVPRRFAISRRNEWMVDQADVVVAYVKHGWGGAAATLRYAERKKKRIVEI